MDLLVVDLRMTAVPVFDLEPVDEGPFQRVVKHLLAEIVERCLGEGRADEDFEPLSPAVVAEIVKVRLGLRLADDLVDAGLGAGVAAGRARHGSSCSPGVDRSIMPLALSPSHV